VNVVKPVKCRTGKSQENWLAHEREKKPKEEEEKEGKRNVGKKEKPSSKDEKAEERGSRGRFQDR